METTLWNICLNFAVKVTEKSEFLLKFAIKFLITLALLNDSIYKKENFWFKDGFKNEVSLFSFMH